MSLKEAAAKASFMSETDAGFDLFEVGKNLNVHDAQILRALAIQPKLSVVQNPNFEDVLSGNKDLLDAVKDKLHHITAYKIGSINITYLIVGHNKEGNIVILRTKAVET